MAAHLGRPADHRSGRSCMMASRTPATSASTASATGPTTPTTPSSSPTRPRSRSRLWTTHPRRQALGRPGRARHHPPRPLNGVMVGCFLTPTTESPYTFPPMLKREIEQVVGEYVLDVRDFRRGQGLPPAAGLRDDRPPARSPSTSSSRSRGNFVMVEMDPRTTASGGWREHRKHEPGNRFEHAIFDYHRHVDELMGRLLAHTDEDTAVFVVSDHGGKRMDGGIRINEWLRREGLLATLRARHRGAFARGGDQLAQTTAWGEGGTTRASSSTSRAESPRARSRRPTTSGFATTWHGGSRRSPTRTENRSAPACISRTRSTRR